MLTLITVITKYYIRRSSDRPPRVRRTLYKTIPFASPPSSFHRPCNTPVKIAPELVGAETIFVFFFSPLNDDRYNKKKKKNAADQLKRPKVEDFRTLCQKVAVEMGRVHNNRRLLLQRRLIFQKLFVYLNF